MKLVEDLKISDKNYNLIPDRNMFQHYYHRARQVLLSDTSMSEFDLIVEIQKSQILVAGSSQSRIINVFASS